MALVDTGDRRRVLIHRVEAINRAALEVTPRVHKEGWSIAGCHCLAKAAEMKTLSCKGFGPDCNEKAIVSTKIPEV